MDLVSRAPVRYACSMHLHVFFAGYRYYRFPYGSPDLRARG